MEITVNSPKTGTKDAEGKVVPRTVTVDYDFGKDLDEAVELFGADVVFSKFVAQVSTDLGNSLRRILNEEKGEAECVEFMAKWKPGVVTKGVKKAKNIPALVAELKSPETSQERKAEIAEQLQTYLDKKIEDDRLAKAALKGIA